jgi:hypothetical protein
VNDSDAIDDIDALQRDLMADVRGSLDKLGPAMMETKIAQQQLFTQSINDGGPASTPAAVALLLDYAKISVRNLAADMKMSRKKLTEMIEGRRDMPNDVITRIWDAIDRKRPGMLDRLRNMK